MKKKILCLAMIALMVIGTPLTANAEHFEGSKNWNVTFDGNNLKDNFTGSDVTESILNIQPGDSITVQINLKNTASKKTDWYLNNEVLNTLENSDAGKASNAEGGAYTYLLKYHDPSGTETVLYDSKVLGGDKQEGDKAEGLEQATLGRKDEFVYLDRLNKGESGYVSLYIELDGETQGNAYQETLAKLRMKFAVEKVNDETITKEIKKEGKDEVIVVTKYVPGMVKTGDNSKLVLFSSLALVSGLGILVYAFVLMKKRREGEE